MNQSRMALMVLVVLVVGFFAVSMVMIGKNGELHAAVEKLGIRVDRLETQITQLTRAASQQEPGR